MQRDIIEGRPSELESQGGAVLRLGADAGVPTPTRHSSTTVCCPRSTPRVDTGNPFGSRCVAAAAIG